MEIILELILEVVLALLFNGPFVRGVRKGLGAGEDDSDSSESPRRKPLSPALMILFYVGIGVATGWASLMVTPEHMLQNKMASYINLALSPLIAGAIMMAIGARVKNRHGWLHLDLFFYGYVFSLAFSVTRFILAYDVF